MKSRDMEVFTLTRKNRNITITKNGPNSLMKLPRKRRFWPRVKIQCFRGRSKNVPQPFATGKVKCTGVVAGMKFNVVPGLVPTIVIFHFSR